MYVPSRIVVKVDGERFWKVRACVAEVMRAELHLRMAQSAYDAAIEQRQAVLTEIGVPASTPAIEWAEQTHEITYAMPMTIVVPKEPSAE